MDAEILDAAWKFQGARFHDQILYHPNVSAETAVQILQYLASDHRLSLSASLPSCSASPAVAMAYLNTVFPAKRLNPKFVHSAGRLLRNLLYHMASLPDAAKGDPWGSLALSLGLQQVARFSTESDSGEKTWVLNQLRPWAQEIQPDLDQDVATSYLLDPSGSVRESMALLLPHVHLQTGLIE